jgi:hypothetical protein
MRGYLPSLREFADEHASAQIPLVNRREWELASISAGIALQ